jgi:ketosteroid isomerase-like protein
MSEEYMEIARRTFRVFNRTFAEGSADLYELLDPEVEWVPMSSLLDGTRYHGHDGVRQWIEEMKREWAELEARPEEIRDLGDDRVLALGSWRARGRRADVVLEIPLAARLGQYRKGKLVLLRTFPDRKDALEAAGLRE